jgi:predicted PurR-regulated permease PerM
VDEISNRAETIFNTERIPSVTEIVDVIVAGAKGAFDALKNLFIGIIVSVYLLGDKARISKIAGSIIDRYASPAQSAAIREEIKFADKTMTKYLAGTLLDALLVGIITYVFALITRLPSPLVLAAIIAVTNVIPIVGPFIGAIPTIFLVLAYTPEKLLMYCIYLLILQQLDGHVFVPKVLGSAVGISGLSALFAIIAGGELFGIAGMILGVPVITIVFDIIKKVHAARMSHKETKNLSMQGGEE